MGCVTQIGEQGWNVGRMAVLAAGWPVERLRRRPSTASAARRCRRTSTRPPPSWPGQLDLVVSAGVEMMSRVPMGSNGGSISERVTDRHEIVMQGTSAELLAREWELVARGARRVLARVAPAGDRRDRRRPVRARDRADRALRSRSAVDRRRRDAAPRFAVDEAPRRDTSAEALAALAPAFDPDGRRHGRQLVADRRRRRGGADRERGRRATRLGARAAGALRLVRPRRRRPDADAARQPAGDRGRRSIAPG